MKKIFWFRLNSLYSGSHLFPQDEYSLAHLSNQFSCNFCFFLLFQPIKYWEDNLVKMILHKFKMYCSKHLSKDKEKRYQNLQMMWVSADAFFS